MTNDEIAMLGLAIQTALLCIQIPTLIALIVYVVKTWEMASATRKSAEVAEKTVKEMREARDQEIAPYVIAYFDVPPGKDLIYLIIKNIGKSMATNIQLSFDPPLQGDKISQYTKDVFVGKIIPSVPPDYEIRTIFEKFSDYLHSSHPLSYNVTISYYGGISTNQREAQYTPDLTPYQGVVFVREYDIDDVAKELKKMVANQVKTTEALRRLLMDREKQDTESEQAQLAAISAHDEVEISTATTSETTQLDNTK